MIPLLADPDLSQIVPTRSIALRAAAVSKIVSSIASPPPRKYTPARSDPQEIELSENRFMSP